VRPGTKGKRGPSQLSLPRWERYRETGVEMGPGEEAQGLLDRGRHQVQKMEGELSRQEGKDEKGQCCSANTKIN